MATRLRPAENAPRRSTNVSLSSDAVAEAKKLGINVSKACETGLISEIRLEQIRRWQEDNREAIAANNAWVEKNGLPLAKYRLF